MNFLHILGVNRQALDIEIGAQYSRDACAGLTETARVLGMSRDGLGIPHVQFIYSVARNGRVESSDRRTLALDAFRGMFAAIGRA